MIFFSVIIPVYNRPEELDELLESLTHQTMRNFEVLIIEDGSERKSDVILEKYKETLNVRYYLKENSGQGFSRNFGFTKASGDYFVIFDSDCIIPPEYFETVSDFLDSESLDAYGGPDRSHGSFSALQKAISYVMTSPITTGGIRGSRKRLGPFHPRSFNMGVSRQVYETCGGFKITRMGEDIEYSIRIQESGFKTGLIPDAYVYHKRRTRLKDFYRQLHFFGRARINIGRFYPSEVRAVHFFPMLFTLGVFFLIILPFISPILFNGALFCYSLFFLLLFIDGWWKTGELKVALLAIPAGFIQLFAYGIGFITEGLKRLFRG